jgi:hypothetical protein
MPPFLFLFRAWRRTVFFVSRRRMRQGLGDHPVSLNDSLLKYLLMLFPRCKLPLHPILINHLENTISLLHFV